MKDLRARTLPNDIGFAARCGRCLTILARAVRLKARRRLENKDRCVAPVPLDSGEQEVGDWFVDAAQGNLHLTPQARLAVPLVTRRDDVLEDIDRQPRSARTPVGADQ